MCWCIFFGNYFSSLLLWIVVELDKFYSRSNEGLGGRKEHRRKNKKTATTNGDSNPRWHADIQLGAASLTEKGEARLYFVYSRTVFCPKFHIQVPFLSMGLSNSQSRKRAPLPRILILGAAVAAAAAAANLSPISWDPSPWEHLGCAVVYMCTQGVWSGEGDGGVEAGHAFMHTHTWAATDSFQQWLSFFPPSQTSYVCGCGDSGAWGGGWRGGAQKKRLDGAPKIFHHNHSAAFQSAVNILAGVPPLLQTNIVQMSPGAMCFFKAGRSQRVESPRSSVIFVLNLLGIVECKPAHDAALFTDKIKEEEEGERKPK